jgi:hypothetical protein
MVHDSNEAVAMASELMETVIVVRRRWPHGEEVVVRLSLETERRGEARLERRGEGRQLVGKNKIFGKNKVFGKNTEGAREYL